MGITDSTVSVQGADLEKIRDVVKVALRHHQHKDRMNATTHMTPVRWSPLTTNLELAVERLEGLLSGLREHEEDNGEDEAAQDAGVVQGAGT